MKQLLAAAFGLCLLLALARASAADQAFEFHAPASAGDASMPAVMLDLAARLLPVYQDGNRERFLATLSAIQLVSGNPRSAYDTRQSLIRERRGNDAGPPGQAAVYDLYLRAKAMEADARIPFAEAFDRAFQSAVRPLGDRDAYALMRQLSRPAGDTQRQWQQAFDQQRAAGRISLPEAVNLVQAYFAYGAYRSFSPSIGALHVRESARRYNAENVLIGTPDGARIAAMVVRPKGSSRLPALLEFSIDPRRNGAEEAASHGYAGVTAYARGIGGSSGEVAPFQRDGEDARAAIAWIARQAWSNGSVGMTGCGYSGYAAFAAAKHVLPVLKAIATCDPTAPGIDFPMRGGIYRNSALRWAFRFTNTKSVSQGIFDDDTQWHAFNKAWYTSGRSYRRFAGIPGPQSVLFDRWLGHPSFDNFWRRMLPDQKQFAQIRIPVLTMTGYYSGAEAGALHYFTEHYRADPRANHTLLIGPYDRRAVQDGPMPVLKGYQLDQAALVDLRELRYQWFDHVLKAGNKPDLLKDRVNFEVMGGNEWRSAPSLQRLGSRLRLYLQPPSSGGAHNGLLPQKSVKAELLRQTFDLADRHDVDAIAPSVIVSGSLTAHNGALFVSEPLPAAIEINGAFSGKLDFITNKQDMDLSILLYELTPKGQYVALFDPPYAFRASYALERTHRHLLKAGARQMLPLRSERLTGRLLGAGSRIVMVLGINKRPDRQINYGTGGNVSDETISDARVPLRIRWYNGSFIELPTHKTRSGN